MLCIRTVSDPEDVNVQDQMLMTKLEGVDFAKESRDVTYLECQGGDQEIADLKILRNGQTTFTMYAHGSLHVRFETRGFQARTSEERNAAMCLSILSR